MENNLINSAKISANISEWPPQAGFLNVKILS